MLKWMQTRKEDKDAELFGSVVDGLKKLYKKHVKPLEEYYKFDSFHSPLLTDSDFDAKPTVLLLGQYSTGKTTFISYLLGRDFPGANIGPEPTTDRFMAVMYGADERVTPGNAVAVQTDKPFTALTKFGTGFLNKFQTSELPCSVLENLTFVDTPGVLSGEKQRIGRSYDFVQVCKWFAERSDMILLLFDGHKLDISDEFKRSIEALRGQDEKIRVVLNKADMVSSQQLMRVYGALMWSLGKVIRTPEVCRVYLGSFWDHPLVNSENAKLFEAEKLDLFNDLFSLPRNAAVRKVNEFVKRVRLAKVHALIISHLRNEMPSLWGKEKAQEKLLAGLEEEFKKIQRNHNVPAGDFPNVDEFREVLKEFKLDKLNSMNQKLIEACDRVLSKHVPELMQKFPQETKNIGSAFMIKDIENYKATFASLNPVDGKVSGAQAKEVLLQSKLPNDTLRKIWGLADIDKDANLDEDEFIVAMQLIHMALMNEVIPDNLPPHMVPPTKKSAVQESANPF
eukprot:Colp12_sorted_trinity150504_noHs@23310